MVIFLYYGAEVIAVIAAIVTGYIFLFNGKIVFDRQVMLRMRFLASNNVIMTLFIVFCVVILSAYVGIIKIYLLDVGSVGVLNSVFSTAAIVVITTFFVFVVVSATVGMLVVLIDNIKHYSSEDRFTPEWREVGEEDGDYYGRAVAAVMRQKNVSVNYIQRHLSISYNEAALLIDQMEKEGVLSAPNEEGKREVLMGTISQEEYGEE